MNLHALWEYFGNFNDKDNRLPSSQDGGWSWIDGQGWQQAKELGTYNNEGFDIFYR